MSTPLFALDCEEASLATAEELRRENAALRRLLALHRGIIERLPVALYVYRLEDRDDDSTLRVLLANQTAMKVSGSREVVGRTLDENFPSLRAQGVPQAYAKVIREGEPLGFENLTHADDGALIMAVSVQALPLPDDCVAVVFEDITPRRRAEADLLRKSGHMQQLLLHAPIALLALTPAGVIELAEGQVEELFGRAPAELPGLKIGALLGQSAGASSALRGAIDGISSSVIVAVGPRTIELTFAPVREGAAKVESAVVVCTDVSDRIAAQELDRAHFELEQQREMRELGTPIMPVAAGVVVMPLIGRIDSLRAEQIIESLLAGITAQRAHTAILDITGVHTLDAQAAEGLMRAARSATLLGAGLTLTGVSAAAAQTLVSLGVDLDSVRTMGSLQEAVAAAVRAPEPTAAQ